MQVFEGHCIDIYCKIRVFLSSEEKMSEYKFENFSSEYKMQKNEFLKNLSRQNNL